MTSSLMGNDIPYVLEVNGKSLIELPIHWELDDAPYFAYVPSEGRRIVQAKSRTCLRGLGVSIRRNVPLWPILHIDHAPMD